MKNCYCPRCGAKQRYKVDDPCRILQACIECGRSLLVKMNNDEMIIKVRAVSKLSIR
ncbi:MAG: hypothetical protein FWC80_01835 [Firmicutes bacterium]|nr:hypothetical protein [Bacillota bacterium]